jgi:MFS family permease
MRTAAGDHRNRGIASPLVTAAAAPYKSAAHMSAVSPTAVRRLPISMAWPRASGPQAHQAFVRLWAAQSVSLAGSEMTTIALPLTAALMLGAGPTHMGLLAAAAKAPFLLVGLLAGVWVDRMACRSVLVAADIGRAALLGWIPLAAALGSLRVEHLYVIAFLTGVLSVFFDVAYQSYLPALVARERLAEGNARLEAGRSVAELVGPLLATGLLHLAAAPFVIAADALSFIFSGLCVRSIPTGREPVARATHSSSMVADVAEGVRLVLRHPLLRPIAACSATMNLFFQVLMAVYVLYVTQQLDLPPALIGVVLGAGSLAALVGALVAAHVAYRLGIGHALMAATALSGVGGLLLALAHNMTALTLPMLIGCQMLLVLGVPIYNINQLSLRQAITPPALRGRVNATNRCLVWGTMPLGSLLGGYLGEAIGLQATIIIAAMGMLVALAWIAASPVRRLTTESVDALSV